MLRFSRRADLVLAHTPVNLSNGFRHGVVTEISFNSLYGRIRSIAVAEMLSSQWGSSLSGLESATPWDAQSRSQSSNTGGNT